MSHHYFVIYFDDETKEWIHDVHTEDIRFSEGTVWNEDKGSWERLSWLNENDQLANDKAAEIMNDGMIWLNRVSAVWHLTGKDK